MAIKTFTAGSILTASDTNTYLNNGGLVYINELTFSGATSASPANLDSIFSATFQNYKIELYISNASAQVTLNYRFRTGGASDSTANYNNQQLIADSTTVAASRSVNQTVGDLGQLTLNDISFFDITIFNPFTAAKTAMLVNGAATSGQAYFRQQANNFQAATSFNGISVYPSSGNITGTMRVYGFRQA